MLCYCEYKYWSYIVYNSYILDWITQPKTCQSSHRIVLCGCVSLLLWKCHRLNNEGVSCRNADKHRCDTLGQTPWFTSSKPGLPYVQPPHGLEPDRAQQEWWVLLTVWQAFFEGSHLTYLTWFDTGCLKSFHFERPAWSSQWLSTLSMIGGTLLVTSAPSTSYRTLSILVESAWRSRSTRVCSSAENTTLDDNQCHSIGCLVALIPTPRKGSPEEHCDSSTNCSAVHPTFGLPMTPSVTSATDCKSSSQLRQPGNRSSHEHNRKHVDEG